MSEAGSAMTSSPASGAAAVPQAEPRSFAARVLGDTLATSGAKLGSAWVLLLILISVFAPLLASSHPLLMHTKDGGWSSPLLKHLDAVDTFWLVTFFTACSVAFLKRWPWPRKLGFCSVLSLAALLLALRPALANWAHEQQYSTLTSLLSPARAWLWTVPVAVIAAGVGLRMIWARSETPAQRVNPSAPASAALSLWLALVLLGMLLWPPMPPQRTIYSSYREDMKSGRITFALHAPIPFSPTDYLRDQPEHRLKAPWWAAASDAPERSHGHWLGTESNGADLLSRLIHASRIALTIGLISTGIAMVIGVVIGGLMGYFSGIVDIIGMRLVEIFEAIPTLSLLIIFVSFFGRNIYMMMVIIGLTGWTGDCRFVRAEFLRLRKQDFIQAARACGLPLHSILFRHMLPNAVAPVLVSASFSVAGAILAESSLSFLGLGLVDEPSWGELLNQAQHGGSFNWWLATFPGMAIFLTVFAYFMLGESLRDALDPHSKRQSQI